MQTLGIDHAMRDAWAVVVDRYRDGSVNWNEQLRAILWRELDARLSGGYEVWCQPRHVDPGLGVGEWRPDLLVTTRDQRDAPTAPEVVAVVECRHVSHQIPAANGPAWAYRGDLLRLRRLVDRCRAKVADPVSLRLDPATGRVDRERRYAWPGELATYLATIGPAPPPFERMRDPEPDFLTGWMWIARGRQPQSGIRAWPGAPPDADTKGLESEGPETKGPEPAVDRTAAPPGHSPPAPPRSPGTAA